jgi:hypothetical protein
LAKRHQTATDDVGHRDRQAEGDGGGVGIAPVKDDLNGAWIPCFTLAAKSTGMMRAMSASPLARLTSTSPSRLR